MKRNVFALSLIILFAVFFLFSFREAIAQGTFECYMTPPSQGSNCRLKKSNCEAGYKPAPCAIFNGIANRKSCEAVHECIPETVAENCITNPGLLGGKCPTDHPIDCKRALMCCKEQKDCDLLPMPAGSICNNMPDECHNCLEDGGVWTALGCIPANSLNEFIRWALSKIVFVASGIAFLLMVFGAIQILTSAGNPERVKAGSELITSALSGLLFIILSFFLLKLIGVDILQIPGLGQ